MEEGQRWAGVGNGSACLLRERGVCVFVCARTCLFCAISVCTDGQALCTAVAAKEEEEAEDREEEEEKEGLSLQRWPGARQYRSEHNGRPP